jgi:hypothetical protein
MGLTYRRDSYLPPAVQRLIALIRENRESYGSNMA